MWTDSLSVRNLVVSFDGFRVLDDLSLNVAPGELRFLIGPNGAGKTTLMDVISGKVRVAAGNVDFEGHDLTRMSEDAIVRAGVGRKFQTPRVFGSLTCLENVEVSAGFRASILHLIRPRTTRTRDRVMSALQLVGLDGRATVLAAELSHGERQWLEIAMLLVQEPRLLLLDEPVAGMTGRERERTGDLLQALEGSQSIIVTEHDMDFVRQFSRTVTVLHMGRVLAEGPVDLIQQDERVQEVYTGRTKVPVEGAA
jgi:urea transport system ATP-binding protein